MTKAAISTMPLLEQLLLFGLWTKPEWVSSLVCRSFTLPAGVAFNDASFSSYLLSRSNTGAAGNCTFQAGMSINGFCGVATGACINFKTPSNGFNFFSSYALTYAPDLIGGTLSSTTTETYSLAILIFQIMAAQFPMVPI